MESEWMLCDSHVFSRTLYCLQSISAEAPLFPSAFNLSLEEAIKILSKLISMRRVSSLRRKNAYHWNESHNGPIAIRLTNSFQVVRDYLEHFSLFSFLEVLQSKVSRFRTCQKSDTDDRVSLGTPLYISSVTFRITNILRL